MARDKAKKLNKPTKIVLIVLLTILAILVTGVWVMYAIIGVHSIDEYAYEGYKGTGAIAHRGFSGKYFDNTREAYQAAAESDFFDGIETDIRLTKDGVWVCVHDNDPFLDKSILVTESNYADIKDLPLDLTKAQDGADTTLTYTIILYEDYLNICKSGNKFAMVEIKGDYSAEQLKPAVEKGVEIMGYDLLKFGSFSLKSIESVREVDEKVYTLMSAPYKIMAYAVNEMGYSVGVGKKILSDTIVDRAHDNGTKTLVYTILTQEEYDKCVELKVDYAICNYEFEK